MATREPVPYRGLPVAGTIALFSDSARSGPARGLAGSRLHHGTRTDWRVMLGLTRGDSILVLGGDAEHVASRLAPWVRQVLSATSGTLPLAANSLDWVIVNGPMHGDGDFAQAVASLLPTVRPGGRVLVSFDNRWGLGGALDAQRRRTNADADGVACRGLRHALDLMASAGCTELSCFAQLPNRRAARTMIPLEPPCPPAAEKFALDQAWKRATPGRALGRLCLHLLIDMHVLRHLYPHYVVVGRKAC